MDVDPVQLGPTALDDIEVNVEPIIVGIEMDPDVGPIPIPTGPNPAGGGRTASGTTNGVNVPQNFMNIFQSVLMNATRGSPNGGSATAATAPSSTVTSESTSTSTTASGTSTPAQDSRSRGAAATAGGAQTQPTTSTHTRSSAHVHYAPRGFNLSPMMSSQPSFDPLLPCRSHHIDSSSLNRRIRHPAGPLMPQRTRSASVPPRGNGINPNPPQEGAASRAEAQASSARNSPSRRGPRSTNVDFEVATQIDVVPMIMTPQGVVAFGSPRTTRPGTGAGSGQTIHSTVHSTASANAAAAHAAAHAAATNTAMATEPVEPSLAAVLGSLQSTTGGGVGSNDNANMVNGLLGIMNEIRNAMTANGGGNQNGPRVVQAPANGDHRSISAYLESLPDYTYVEGESLLTDLLMLMARNTTFADLVSILMGSTDSLNGLQTPLRQFVRRYVLVPPNDDEHDIDAAVLHLVDMSYHHFEEMAREANVKQDLDFAETLHRYVYWLLSISVNEFVNDLTEYLVFNVYKFFFFLFQFHGGQFVELGRNDS